ncbi:hypothetical protein NEF87_003822 [Candidatus Lokiarchaeum ossiferum]|uniref:Uncharacterized protein n=1 Tax=Candidatus Lokiarchaeum ossiferum TaxID=2951803 RepID=A0ABY6HVI9_9ARCH|nr:hypothetical protein NEF87_003822 [Candidatus Lokiarchaeum sp. B-35]
MEFYLLILYISMGFNMALYAGIAGYLIYRAKKTGLTSLLHLAISLIFIDICFVFYLANGGGTLIYHFFRAVGISWLLIFNYMTFLKGNKKWTTYYLSYALLSTILICISYGIYESNGSAFFRAMSDILFGLLTMIISSWQYYTAREAYRKIKEVELEPYIKKRYKLYLVASIALFYTGAFSFFIFLVYDSVGTAILFLGVSLSSLIYLMINFLIWVMPKSFKEKLNQGWSPKVEELSSEEELSEEELMAKFMEDGDSE